MTWRTGTKLGRTLYRDEVLVGMVDTPEIAAEIVEAMNSAAELREEVARLEHNAIDDEAQLLKVRKAYDTLRENHTELQREYRELEEAVRWFLEHDGAIDECARVGVYLDDRRRVVDDESFEDGDRVAALKRLHARNK